MNRIFVNLKRFDVPRALGGVCPTDAPDRWISETLEHCIALGLGCLDTRITFFPPESLILTAAGVLRRHPADRVRALSLGTQGVFFQDVAPGGNFGAFTSSLPAAAAVSIGASWAIIGHSEERKAKEQIILAYDSEAAGQSTRALRAAVDKLLQQQVARALDRSLKVLFCIGETAEERGADDPDRQRDRVRAVLRGQLERGLGGLKPGDGRAIVIGYEPVWAIGPGKVPPDTAYIGFVADTVKQITADLCGAELPVVYGGGLKAENAAGIAAIPSVDGGLVALTRFSGAIGFYPDEFAEILRKYAGQ